MTVTWDRYSNKHVRTESSILLSENGDLITRSTNNKSNFSYTILNLTLTDMHHNISYGDELPKHVPLLLRLQITGI